MALVTLSLVLIIRYIDPGFIESVRYRYFDTLITGKPLQEMSIKVVDIDEAALDKYGQWPFPRNIYAEIIEDLYRRGAGLVIFNVLMPEADRFGGDDRLGKTLQEHPVFLPIVAGDKGKGRTRPPQVVVEGDFKGKLVEYGGIIANVAPIERAAAGSGIANTLPEIDGVVRRLPLVVKVGDRVYPSQALEIVRAVSGDGKITVKFTKTAVDSITLGDGTEIEVDGRGRLWVDWSLLPSPHSLTSLPEKFDGDIVIVGLSAAGLVNPVSTSRGEVWPHHVLASAIGTMLSGTTITRPDGSDRLEILLIMVLGLAVIGFAQWRRT